MVAIKIGVTPCLRGKDLIKRDMARKREERGAAVGDCFGEKGRTCFAVLAGEGDYTGRKARMNSSVHSYREGGGRGFQAVKRRKFIRHHRERGTGGEDDVAGGGGGNASCGGGGGACLMFACVGQTCSRREGRRRKHL